MEKQNASLHVVLTVILLFYTIIDKKSRGL